MKMRCVLQFGPACGMNGVLPDAVVQCVNLQFGPACGMKGGTDTYSGNYQCLRFGPACGMKVPRSPPGIMTSDLRFGPACGMKVRILHHTDFMTAFAYPTRTTKLLHLRSRILTLEL